MKVLITGGAGFIGSNLVSELLNTSSIELVRVIDDLSNGSIDNVSGFLDNPKFEFIHDSIANYDICLKVTEGVDKVCHQAAMGSIPRSIADPISVSRTNITGSLNLMHAAVLNIVDRFVFASSSSVYGDDRSSIKVESNLGMPLNPYAATKATAESFARVFNIAYKMDFIGLRYFNVFGPKQKMDSPYSAVIPNFCKAFLNNIPPIIFGDGETKRDFTYINNVVEANKIALMSNDQKILNNFYNIGCGSPISLNKVIETLREISGKDIQPTYQSERMNDVRHSQADILKATNVLGYKPAVDFKEGLETTFNWYKENYKI